MIGPPTSSRARVLVVLGMPRCGFGAIGHALAVLTDPGTSKLPDDATLAAGARRQDREIRQINTLLLHRLGRDWHALPALDPVEFDSIDTLDLERQAERMLQEAASADAPVRIHDPRTARLMPFWVGILQRTPLATHRLLLLRHPLRAAASLARSEGFGADKSCALWLAHFTAALAACDGLPSVVIDHDSLLDQPRDQLERLAQSMAIDASEATLARAVVAIRAAPRNARHMATDPDHATQVQLEAMKLYRLLTQQAADAGPFNAADFTRAIGREFTRPGYGQTAAPVSPEATPGPHRESAADQERMEHLRNALDAREAHIAQLQIAVSASDAAIANLTRHLEEEKSAHAQAAAEVVRRGVWALGLDAERVGLQHRLDATEFALDATRRSTSWRLTWPLRAIRPLLPGASDAQRDKLRRALWRLLRDAYHGMPLTHEKRIATQRFFYRRFPGAFARMSASGIASFELWQAREGAALSFARAGAPAAPAAAPDPAAAAPRFTPQSAPLVSIIIPVHGKIDYTLACLRSLAAHACTISFEVIVVDDASPDDSAVRLAQVAGIRIITHHENQGFIRACNAGASVAAGQYLLFLNNDTEILPHWLDRLIGTFRDFPDTGLVGSKLLYPDGRLQEAGGLIWNDASGWNFGRLDDPRKPEYNYLRDVDYCSGASIAIPRQLFETLGAFDTRYAPAYFEDADLAFAVRRAGYRVLYQPASQLIHQEGISSGTDPASGAKAYQTSNREKFAAKWRSVLAAHGPAGEAPRLERDRQARGRMLIIDATTPTPDQDAGSVTAFYFQKIFIELGFKVVFAPENLLHFGRYTEAQQSIGVECLYAPYVNSIEAYLAQHGREFDVVLLYRAWTARNHIDAVKRHCGQAKVIFDTVDLHYLREEREAQLSGSTETAERAARTKEVEIGLMRQADATILLSAAEVELLHREDPGLRLYNVPLLLEIPGSRKSFAQRRDIVFIGGYQHTPNVDAVDHFVAAIWPLVRERLPDARFLIIGSKMPERFAAFAQHDNRIVPVGFVENIEPYFDACRLTVVPLRYGAGIKGKIGTSASYGVPSVATSIAVEGMGLTDGVNVVIADDPLFFAHGVVRLYEEAALWEQVSAGVLEFVRTHYSLEAGAARLAALLAAIGVNEKPALPTCSATPIDESIWLEGAGAETLGDTERKQRVLAELKNYAGVTNVHDLPAIYHYWSNKYLARWFRDAGVDSVNGFFLRYMRQCCTAAPTQEHKFISVGAGNCDQEIALARELVDGGHSNFTFECVDINGAMLERGRALAGSSGLSARFRFNRCDVISWNPAPSTCAVLIAHQSLHHVLELEALFEKIAEAIGTEGVFLTWDVIGRNGHMRWPEALDRLQPIWESMPAQYKYNHLLKRIEEHYDNWDCSGESFEGIRAQDILPQLIERFSFEFFLGLNCNINVFVDRCFGHNFDPDKPEDCAFIDRVAQLDADDVKQGRLKPTQLLAAMRARTATLEYANMVPAAAVRRP